MRIVVRCKRIVDHLRTITPCMTSTLSTSDVARLGMLSFDSPRARRLVADTGMHHFGWSGSRAVKFMWDHTATTQSNVDNEIDRYIGWPRQALGCMIGRREIVALREEARRRLAGRFDIRDFHAAVLGNGAVPSTCWTRSSPAGSSRSMTRKERTESPRRRCPYCQPRGAEPRGRLLLQPCLPARCATCPPQPARCVRTAKTTLDRTNFHTTYCVLRTVYKIRCCVS